MEENKIDPFQIIGFGILMVGLFWWMNTLPEIESPVVKNQNNNELAVENSTESLLKLNNDISSSLDLTDKENNSFLNINSEPVSENEIIIENEDLILKFNSKGGLLVEAQLKKFTDYKGDPLYMVKDGNQNISLNFSTLNGKSVNTGNYNFNQIVNKLSLIHI